MATKPTNNAKYGGKSNEKEIEPELQGSIYDKRIYKKFQSLSHLHTLFISDLESSLLALERLESGSPEFWPDHSKYFGCH